ncbi:MAG: hypothetical protein HWQ43_14455 [Nostoc sp. JL31]|uniref:hypothetical protein n=1 Tax=Nostoc sp. JL31 TaxID=2815395 RepID=UPI0025FDD36D|nr:hypothetical protein [Nostoc sp. JL31]MBN3890308.1 hypothetical protein [Nostoc sp. JL31]
MLHLTPESVQIHQLLRSHSSDLRQNSLACIEVRLVDKLQRFKTLTTKVVTFEFCFWILFQLVSELYSGISEK